MTSSGERPSKLDLRVTFRSISDDKVETGSIRPSCSCIHNLEKSAKTA